MKELKINRTFEDTNELTHELWNIARLINDGYTSGEMWELHEVQE